MNRLHRVAGPPRLKADYQLFLHAGFGNAAVLEKTGNDEDEVVRLIATFYKQQGEVPMKHSAVRRSSLVVYCEEGCVSISLEDRSCHSATQERCSVRACQLQATHGA